MLHDVTGGDVAAGFLSLLLPLVALFGVLAVNGRRRGSRNRDLWALVFLLIPLDLTPFGRADTDVALENRIDSSLPYFLQGILLGVVVLAAPLVIFGVLQTRRRQHRP